MRAALHQLRDEPLDLTHYTVMRHGLRAPGAQSRPTAAG
jgi:hypothetical protein